MLKSWKWSSDCGTKLVLGVLKYNCINLQWSPSFLFERHETLVSLRYCIMPLFSLAFICYDSEWFYRTSYVRGLLTLMCRNYKVSYLSVAAEATTFSGLCNSTEMAVNPTLVLFLQTQDNDDKKKTRIAIMFANITVLWRQQNMYSYYDHFSHHYSSAMLLLLLFWPTWFYCDGRKSCITVILTTVALLIQDVTPQ